MAAPDVSAESFGLTPHAQLEAGTPVLDADDGEELAKRFESISLVLGDNLDMGQGSLYITTRYHLSHVRLLKMQVVKST